ncbi:hypothetical protein LTR27_012828 [Elasticomyces elasticus]|nr:hypothetical protein LTR27_012828 [Elasticomyces elasticus]
MFSKIMLIAPAALSLVAAVPLNKRDVVWVTETDVAVVTVPVTTTLWVNPGESVPTSSATVSHYGHHRSHVTSTVQSTVTIASSSSAESSAEAPSTTSTSVYVAPTTTSTSEYVAPTTLTSSYVAPTTTSTSEYVAPTTPTSTWVAPETTSEAPAPSSSAASATTTEAAATGTSPSGSTYTGDITYYAPGLGSCGWTNTEDEAIVAIPHGMMENGINPNLNPLCGQYITISYAGAEHKAKIVDTCGGCDGQAIDLTQTLFDAVAPSGDGRVHGVEWWFNSS